MSFVYEDYATYTIKIGILKNFSNNDNTRIIIIIKLVLYHCFYKYNCLSTVVTNNYMYAYMLCIDRNMNFT